MRRLRRPTWLSDSALYILFRALAVMAAALPPAAKAVTLFPAWREERVIRLEAGLGFGGLLAVIILFIVFKDTVIGTLKKHMGMVRVMAVTALWLLLMGLRVAAPHIPKMEEIAFWAMIGGLVSWGLSGIAMVFAMRGGIERGNDRP